MDALSRLLVRKPGFLHTPGSTLLDLWACAVVCAIIAPPIGSPLKQITFRFGNFTGYCNRLQAPLYGHAASVAGSLHPVRQALSGHVLAAVQHQ